MKAAEDKRTRIVKAAIRRFGHFGVDKTTMNDISQDVSMSKASLYYYFPDKNALLAASLEQVIGQSFDQVSNKLAQMDQSLAILEYLLDSRMEFITRHYKLFEYFFGSGPNPPPELTTLVTKARDSQLDLIRMSLRFGVERGELNPMDIDEMAQIILLAIEGIRFSFLKDADGLLYPGSEEFETILRLQKKMIQVLLRGLRA